MDKFLTKVKLATVITGAAAHFRPINLLLSSFNFFPFISLTIFFYSQVNLCSSHFGVRTFVSFFYNFFIFYFLEYCSDEDIEEWGGTGPWSELRVWDGRRGEPGPEPVLVAHVIVFGPIHRRWWWRWRKLLSWRRPKLLSAAHMASELQVNLYIKGLIFLFIKI